MKKNGILTRLRRDVVLRSGFISAAATLIALLILTYCLWVLLVEILDARVEDSLIARHEVSLLNVNEFSNDELGVIRKFRQGLPVRDEGVFAWLDNEGKEFSSNVSGLECREGFYDKWLDITPSASGAPLSPVPADQIDPARHDRFRFLAKKRDENCLVFGTSMFEVDELRGALWRKFFWLAPLCLLPALFISLFQSWRLRTRLIRLGRAVKNLAAGDLDARMPVDGDDDIDRLAISANHSFAQLQESVGTLTQLTSVMAHDLRAPLNRISIPLDKAMQANIEGRTDVESLQEVSGGLADVRSVFDALLRISQIESGRRRAKFSKIDLCEIAEGLFEIYQPVVEEAERELKFELIGEGTAEVLGDADLIRQAVVNLIENATRYSPKGACIRVGVKRDSQQPSVYVSDDGPGLPAAERPRVLRRLYRYEGSTDGQSGHGLGLALVNAVTDLHNGEVKIEDAKPGLLVTLGFNS